ncbi:hypothetical protein C8R43DRAFT_1131886 [Mycena crocata]|nr:hypothetical protein C8R43DRAFT_1131886 [Mycena crocata]
MDLYQEKPDDEVELDQAAEVFVQRDRLWRINCDILRLGLVRESLMEQLEDCRYPVLTLPSEIISEIFIHVLDFSSLDAPCPAPTLAPMVLAQICRHWRQIALSLPSLWSTISLEVNRKTFKQWMIMARTLLQRSKSSPLSISLKYGMDHQGLFSLGARIEEVFLELSQHFIRLQHLDFGVTLMSPVLEQLMQSPMPRLTHLTLWMDRLYTGGSRPVLLLPETVPLLHSIELHHFNTYSSLVLPWKQITTLTCVHIEYRHLSKLLQEVPALRHCQVIHMARGRADRPQPIILPHLESFIFSLYDPDENPLYGIFALEKMILPALRVLQIPETFLAYPSFMDLHALISRSKCNLQKLDIIDLTHTTKELYMDTFPEIPSISFLHQLPGRNI